MNRYISIISYIRIKLNIYFNFANYEEKKSRFSHKNDLVWKIENDLSLLT